MAISVQDLLRQFQQDTYNTPGIGDGIPGNRRMAGSFNPVYNQTAPENVDTNTINVEGVRTGGVQPPMVPISTEDLVPRSLGNLADAQEVQQANKNTQEGIQHKGLFGVKGTLRDLLGFVGDTLLTSSGNAPIYGRTRQREQEGAAMAGFTRDPGAAAERMTGINPVLAQKLQDLAISEHIKQQQLASADAARQSLIQDRRFENITKATNLIGRVFASPVAKTRPDLAMKQAQAIADRVGVTLEEIGIKLGMTSDEMDLYSSMDMSVDKTMNIPFKERQLDISQQNADANTARANRPPAGRAAPRKTVAQLDAEVGEAVLSGRATPAQQKYYDDRLKRGGAKPGGRATPRPAGVAGPPPGFKLGRKIN